MTSLLRLLEVVPYISGELAARIAKDTILQAKSFSPTLKAISAVFKLSVTWVFALTAVGKAIAANKGIKNLFTKKRASCLLF